MTNFLEWFERHIESVTFRSIQAISTLRRPTWAAATVDDHPSEYEQKFAFRSASLGVQLNHESQTLPVTEERSGTFTTNGITKSSLNNANFRTPDEKRLISSPCSPCSCIKSSEDTESPPDFSESGIRLTTLNENGKEKYALVLTAEFVDSAQDAIRNFNCMDRIHEKIRALQGSIDSAHIRLSEIEHEMRQLASQSVGPSLRNESDSSAEQLADLRTRQEGQENLLQDLAQSLKEWDDERKLTTLSKTIEDRFFFDLLEQPLREGGLIETKSAQSKPNIGTIPVQLDNGYHAYEPHGVESVNQTPHPVSTAPITGSELHKLNLRHDLSAQEEKVEEVKQDLENFDEIYEQNMAQFQEDRADGVHDDSVSNFDRFHVDLKSKLTRQLIESEAKLRALRRQVRDAGIGHYVDDSSIFQDDPYDGYGELEDEMIRCCPAERITHWQEDVAHYDPLETKKEDVSMPEADSWESETVDIGDSISCVGPEPKRRKLAHWNELRRWRRGDEIESVGRPAVWHL